MKKNEQTRPGGRGIKKSVDKMGGVSILVLKLGIQTRARVTKGGTKVFDDNELNREEPRI
jgi:hypothetical protein